MSRRKNHERTPASRKVTTRALDEYGESAKHRPDGFNVLVALETFGEIVLFVPMIFVNLGKGLITAKQAKNEINEEKRRMGL